MHRAFALGLASVILAAGLTTAAPAHAEPGYACTPQYEGELGYEEFFNWQGEGWRRVYQCYSSQWYLVDIQYCSYYSGCISL